MNKLKAFLLAFLLASLPNQLSAADNIITPPGSGVSYLKSNAGDLWGASVLYKTDGNGHVLTLGGATLTADNLKYQPNTGKVYLLDNASHLFPASIGYTTDGSGNVIPIPSGGGGGGVTSVSGTAPVVSSGGATPAISMAAATNSVNGYLTSADHTTFAAKQAALSFSSPLLNTANTISCNVSSGSQAGCLSSTDWSTFNGKQAAGNYITALTSDVSASGPGSVAATVNSVGGSSASNVNLATTQVLNGPSKLMWVDQHHPGSYTPDGSVLRPFVKIPDAISQIITNNDGGVYVIMVAPGIYTDTVNLNNAALNNLAIVAMSNASPSMSNDALDITQISGDINSTSNNAGIRSIIIRGFDITGNINFTGDTNGTTFCQYGCLFSNNILYPSTSPAVTFNNASQVIWDGIGSAIVSGAGGIAIQNVSSFLVYHSFLGIGTLSLVTNGGANKPSGFSATSAQTSFGNLTGPTTVDAGSSLVQRFERVSGTINNAGTLTSISSAYSAVVTNSGTWNSSGDSEAATALHVNTGTFSPKSQLYSALAYTPATPGNWPVVPSVASTALDSLAANKLFNTDGLYSLANTSDATKLAKWDLSGQTTATTLTVSPQNTSSMVLHVPQVATAAGAGMALVQDETTGFIFSNGITSSLGGANSMMQLANASTANRAQIKLHSYFNGTSVAGVSTLTSRSGTIGTNSAVVAGQDYSKWTAQAGATTAGSAPISGTFSFKANTVNSLTVTSDYHLQLTNLAGTLADAEYLTSEGHLLLGSSTDATNARLLLKNGHLVSQQTTAPTATVNANAGTGATCTVANATDLSGTISLTTTAVAPASGDQCDVNFNLAYNVAPICTFSPVNANAAQFAVSSGVYSSSSTSAMSINFAVTDAVGHAYQWAYHCVETQ